MSTRAAERVDTAASAGSGIRPGWLLSTALVWTIGIGCAAFFWSYLNHGVHGVDSGAYWSAARHGNPYHERPGVLGAYLYSPAFTQLIWPLAQLPRSVFIAVWMLLEAATFGWLLRPLGVRWGVPAFCLCMAEVVVGNIYAFLAAVAVLGLRRPALWALPLLTKITPGLGPVWFAVRREWRPLIASVATTAVIAAVSFAISPHQWLDWFRFLFHHGGENQLWLPARAIAAVGLTAFAARTSRYWMVGIAMLLANPMVLHSEMALTLLAALPRLLRRADGAR
jgi:hypothetical protein